MKGLVRYILIDDDLISLELIKNIIRNTFENPVICDFTDAKSALHYLNTDFTKNIGFNNIILLDLDMPEMNGWNFLEHYDKLDDKVKSRIKIIIVSGYDNVENRKRAYMNRYVSEFIAKKDLYENFHFRMSRHLSAA